MKVKVRIAGAAALAGLFLVAGCDTAGGPQGFDILLDTNTVNVAQGESISIGVSAIRSRGFTDPITLTITGLPSGVHAVFNDSPMTGTQSLLILDVDDQAALSDLDLTVQGTAEDKQDQISLSLHIQSQADLLAQFGYGTMKSPGDARPATGSRHLLIILLDNLKSSISFTHSNAYYYNLAFGNAAPTLEGYFANNSAGAFNLIKRAAIGPIAYTPPNAGYTNMQLRAFALMQAAEAGFDFDARDSNGDGRVTPSELMVLVVDNNSTNAGQTGPSDPGCVRPTGAKVDVCLIPSLVGEYSSLNNYAHELSHQLNTVDVYGSGGLSFGYTLMSSSVYGTDAMDSFHLDPWHKMRLGWLQPRVRMVGEYPTGVGHPGSCTTIDAAQYTDQSGFRTPLILFDPRRGPNEYFVIEFRTRSTPLGGAYDAAVPRRGLVPWYVRTTSGNALEFIPGLYGSPGATDAVDWVYFANDGLRQVGGNVWTAALGLFGLNLLTAADTSGIPSLDSGIRLQAGELALTPAYIEAEWSGDGTALVPRIHDAPASARAGEDMILTGVFGANQGSRRVILASGPTTHMLYVNSWTCSQIAVNVPITVPAGTYRLNINADETGSVRSNSLPIEVTP